MAQGRTFVLVIGGMLVGLSAVIIMAYVLRFGAHKLPQQIVRFALTVGLVVAIYRGHQWARWTVVVLAGIAATTTGWALFREGSHMGPVSLLLYTGITLVYGLAALALGFSTSVEAFMRRQRGEPMQTNRQFDPPASSRVPCPKCGKPIAAAWKICPHCNWRGSSPPDLEDET